MQPVVVAVYPNNWIQINSNTSGAPGIVELAQFGSLVLELWTLADRAGVPELRQLAEVVPRVIHELYPTRVCSRIPQPLSAFTGFLVCE